ncbi:hypothetical protein [Citrobacter sp. JGM124]|uniref:lipopolysaccharide biosynthesis protein n=1 Tax=Citrobacter sp. JGM124 TaxID=2799789 RepID=UPI001BA9DD34|nr:hypothetical protein [Citrobacter sp. JGM124]MBS0847957.1 hypothetical protein [Citrobacter sp. JGM124]
MAINNKLISYLSGNLGVFSIRFFYFILLTFFLDTEELAEFTTSISISAILLSICTYGNYNLFMRRNSQGELKESVLGEYIVNSFLALIFFSIILYSLSLSFDSILNISTKVLLVIFIGEFFFTSIPSLFKAYALSAYDNNIFVDALTNIVTAILLLLTACSMFFFKDKIDLYRFWLFSYPIVGLLSFFLRVFLWRGKIRLPSIKMIPLALRMQFSSGHSFMVSAVFRNGYLNLDRILILNILGPQIAGYYAISFRFFNVFLMMLNSFSGVKEARLYQIAEESLIKLYEEVKLINHETIKYLIYSIPIWGAVAIGIYISYPKECFYIFICLFFLCPFQLLTFTFLNVLNSSGFENQRLFYMLLGSIIASLISIFMASYLSWLAIILGSIASSLTVLCLAKLTLYKRINNE